VYAPETKSLTEVAGLSGCAGVKFRRQEALCVERRGLGDEGRGADSLPRCAQRRAARISRLILIHPHLVLIHPLLRPLLLPHAVLLHLHLLILVDIAAPIRRLRFPMVGRVNRMR
jgi:hypothetical protein